MLELYRTTKGHVNKEVGFPVYAEDEDMESPVWLLDVGECLYDVEMKEAVYEVNVNTLEEITSSVSILILSSWYIEYMVLMYTTLNMEDPVVHAETLEGLLIRIKNTNNLLASIAIE